MKSSSLTLTAAAGICVGLFGLSPRVHAAPGDLDTTFPAIAITSTYNFPINSAVTQADGQILVGGLFSAMNGNPRYAAARFSSTGVLDTNYAPNANSVVNSIAVQTDGSAFYTGGFTGVKYSPNVLPIARAGLAKMNSAGGLITTFDPDMTFNPPNGYQVNTIVEQPFDYYLIGTNVGLFRLAKDGKESTTGFTSYTPGGVTGVVSNVVVQPDNKIVMGGAFSGATAAVDSDFFERLASDGKKDSTFNTHNIDGQVRATALLPDGRFLVAGDILGLRVTPNAAASYVEQRGILRYSAAGVFDNTFRPVVDGFIHAVVLQADGKILIGGNFTTVRSTATSTQYTRRGIARLNADGTVDPTFDAKISSGNVFLVNGIFLDSTGSVLISGLFQFPGSNTFRALARLKNDPIVNDLRALDSTTVQWMRGGAAPEAKGVVFEYSTNGTTYAPLSGTGFGTRIAGGWRITSTNPLPAQCFIRAQAKVAGGVSNASTGIVAATTTYPIPKIAVTTTSGTNIANGTTTALGLAGTITPQEFSLLVKNPGTGGLTITSATVTGTNASLFTVTASPTAPVGGPTGSAPLTIRFAPDSIGVKSATITLASNDTAVAAFSFTVTGEGVTDQEAWRFQNFGVTTPTGEAADDADPDGDGQDNLFEFIAGLNPKDPASKFVQRLDATPPNRKIIFGPIFSGSTYQVQSSTTLETGSWADAIGTSADELTERTFTETGTPQPKRFYRIKISRP